MISITLSSSSNEIGPSFLTTASRNYLSARILFLNGQFYDAGILAHEAIEKIMKAALYLKDPKRSPVRGHVLTSLRPGVEAELGIDLSEFDTLFNYFEVCYDYRYPDDPKPKDFATGTVYVKLLDKVFISLHSKCLELIQDDLVRNRSGIFEQCVDYFLDRHVQKVELLLEHNENLTIAEIDNIKVFWHKKGYYIKDNQGVTRFPEGMVTREH